MKNKGALCFVSDPVGTATIQKAGTASSGEDVEGQGGTANRSANVNPCKVHHAVVDGTTPTSVGTLRIAVTLFFKMS